MIICVLHGLVALLVNCARDQAGSSQPVAERPEPSHENPMPKQPMSLKDSLAPENFDFTPSTFCDINWANLTDASQTFFARKSSLAATTGARKFFSHFIDNPSDLGLVDENGQGLMHWIVQNDRVELAKAMVEGGFLSGLSRKDRFGRLPLHYVVSAEMAALLWPLEVRLEADNTNSPLIRANTVRDSELKTPLQYMASRGRAMAVQYVAHRACMTRAGQLLPWRGEDLLNAVDIKGRSALHEAAILGDVVSADSLSRCGTIRFTLADREGRTALHYAAMHGEFGVGYILLRHIDEDMREDFANLRDAQGNTALHYAYACKNMEAIDILLHFAHADPTVRNSRDEVPARAAEINCANTS